MKKDRPEEWFDVNIFLGSEYQQQVDLKSGRWQHRRLLSMLPGEREQHPDEGWQSGVAPK